MVKEKTEEGDYEGGLEALDRLLELAKDDAKVLRTLEKCLDEFINQLMEEEKYDEIRRLAEKYGQLAAGIDFEGILKESDKPEMAEQETEEQENSPTEDVEEDSLEQEEQETESEESVSGETTALQSDNWVDELYQMIVAEDADAVFAIMEQPDFIEKCEAFPQHNGDYRILTSDGKVMWVINDDYLFSVVYYPNGDGGDIEYGAPPSGWGDYIYEVFNGEKRWLIKSTLHQEDGSTSELPQNSTLWIYHT